MVSRAWKVITSSSIQCDVSTLFALDSKVLKYSPNFYDTVKPWGSQYHVPWWPVPYVGKKLASMAFTIFLESSCPSVGRVNISFIYDRICQLRSAQQKWDSDSLISLLVSTVRVSQISMSYVTTHGNILVLLDFPYQLISFGKRITSHLNPKWWQEFKIDYFSHRLYTSFYIRWLLYCYYS